MTRRVPAIVVLLIACALTLATCGTAHAAKSRDAACALIEFAVYDGALTADWYLDAHKFLRANCQDKEAARAAREKFCAAVIDGGESEPRVCRAHRAQQAASAAQAASAPQGSK